MKNYNNIANLNTLLFIILGISLSVCKEKDPVPEGPTWGTLEVSINGKNWTTSYPNGFQHVKGGRGTYSTSVPCQDTTYSVGSSLYNKDAFIREMLSFIKVIPDKGRYKVIKFTYECIETDSVYADFRTVSNDGDVLQDIYSVLESEDNYIVIDSYDSKRLEIKGSFQVTFIIERRSAIDPSALPDTLRFTGGTFHTKFL